MGKWKTWLGPAIVAIGGISLLRPRRVEVAGNSMVPTLLPGDCLLVLRDRRLQAGDLALLCDPRSPQRRMVKRVRAVGPNGIDVRGDNAAASTDSRTFGLVSPSLQLGRVVYRYAPAARSGPVVTRFGAGRPQ